MINCKIADVAQSVEHILGKDEVTSSNLVISSKKFDKFRLVDFFYPLRKQWYIISRRLYLLSQWWYTRLSPWWYTKLRFDDMHAFGVIETLQFEPKQKVARISFLSSLHKKRTSKKSFCFLSFLSFLKIAITTRLLFCRLKVVNRLDFLENFGGRSNVFYYLAFVLVRHWRFVQSTCWYASWIYTLHRLLIIF